MKATKVMIAAAVVALMFLAVPFTSVASDADADWANAESVYFESDDKMTWDSYAKFIGMTKETLASETLTLAGYNVTDNTYEFTDIEFSNITMKGGKSASFVEKTDTSSLVNISSYDFKFTVTAKTVNGTLFTDVAAQNFEDVTKYLGLEDGKLKVGDKLEITGTLTGDSVNKSVYKYKNTDETNAIWYSYEVNKVIDMDLSMTVKFIRGEETKNYEQSSSFVDKKTESTSYELDDEKYISKDEYYAYTVKSNVNINGSATIKYDGKECSSAPSSTVKVDTEVSYKKIDTSYIKEISEIEKSFAEDKLAKVSYKDWLSYTTIADEATLKTELGKCGTLSSNYSDVNDACESIINPPEPEETPVNQWLFFGAFIVILAIAVVVAVVLREKKEE